MKIKITILLLVLSTSCLANISSDISLGLAVNDTKKESNITARSGFTYYTDWNLGFSTSLSYFDLKRGNFGGELSLLPYIETDNNNRVYAELGMRNDFDSLFIGLGSHIKTETPFSFVLSSRLYNRIFEGEDESYYAFTIGVSYDWQRNIEKNKPINTTLDTYEYESTPQVENVISDDVGIVDPVATIYVKENFVLYTVKEGDYLYKIARENGMSFVELLNVNTQLLEVENLDMIYPGLILYINP